MKEEELIARVQQLAAALAELFAGLTPSKRGPLYQAMRTVELTSKHGLAAIYLLGWLWITAQEAGLECLRHGDKIEELLAQYRNDMPVR